MPVSAVILAAGRSLRFGEDKLRLEIGGKTMLERVLGTVAALDFDEVIVVAGSPEAARLCEDVYGGLKAVAGPDFPAGRGRGGLKAAINPGGGAGLGSSVKLGVALANPENHMMFFLADQPFIQTGTVSGMLRRGGLKAAVVMGCRAGIPMTPAVFPPSFRERLLQIGDGQGAKAALGGGDIIEKVELTASEALDIDTPAAYMSAICPNKLVILRGAGDLATGVIQALFMSGFSVIALESARPTAIRRGVSLCEAVYDGRACVEGITARLAKDVADIGRILQSGEVPVAVDPAGDYIVRLRPAAVVDAVMAKRNTGTRRGMADAVIALGPGFTAGGGADAADAVIETSRGHWLGRIIFEGAALPDTGIPGKIGGAGAERVVRSPAEGVFRPISEIGQIVRCGDVIAHVGGAPVTAAIDGVLRGVLRGGLEVTRGFKLADIDPRGLPEYCRTVSDKARCVGAASVVALLYLMNGKG